MLTGGIAYGIYLLSVSAVVTISAISVLLIAAGAVSLFAGLPGAKKNIESLK